MEVLCLDGKMPHFQDRLRLFTNRIEITGPFSGISAMENRRDQD